MKTIILRTIDALKSRFARNLYFWLLLLSSKFEAGLQESYYFCAGLCTILLFAALYINILLLVPLYLSQKKYLTYISLLFPVVFVCSFLYALVMKIMLYESLDPRLSNIMWVYNDYANSELSFISTLRVWPTYFGVMLTGVCIFNMAWYAADYEHHEKIIEETHRKQIEIELSFLKSQINPHFLFNTLNNLYSLIIVQSELAKEIVPKLSSILRYLLYETDANVISFEKEKEIMEAYIELELIRLQDGNNIMVTISSDNNIDIPPLLWAPILENTFKHGTRFINKKYFIDFRFIIENNLLMIYSKNTVGTFGAKNNDHQPGGIGLSNFRKRLSLLYPEKHTIVSTRKDDYYIMEVQIQLI